MPCRALPLLLLGALACAGADAPPVCGLNAVVGPTVLLDQFNVPNQTLIRAPARLPEKLVARLAVGPAFSAIVGRADSEIVVGVNGALPANTTITFGVLVVDPAGKSLGVMLYELAPIDGAPRIGSVSVGNLVVPLIGIQLDASRIQDARCPLFPDSVAAQ